MVQRKTICQNAIETYETIDNILSLLKLSTTEAEKTKKEKLLKVFGKEDKILKIDKNSSFVKTGDFLHIWIIILMEGKKATECLMLTK